MAYRQLTEQIPDVMEAFDEVHRAAMADGAAALAAVNSCPASLGQAATQAPQPTQAAASVALRHGHGEGVGVGRGAGRRADVAAGLDDVVERRAVDDPAP